MGSEAPWWSDGLPFACTQCGKCCRSRGRYQYVYVNHEERARLARHLDLAPQDFLDRYTRLDEDGYRTLRFVDGACVFLEEGRCRVHEAKPTQCRTWPFWSELLTDAETYRREVQSFCPGSATLDTQPGTTKVPAASIRRQMRETDQAMELE